MWVSQISCLMSFTDSLYLVFLATGFAVGFGHCIGMCGPIVVSFSLNIRKKRLVPAQLLYNGGRTVTYGLLGGVMGWTGAFTQVIGGIAFVQKGVMVFAGVVIIIMGLAMGGWIPCRKIFRSDYYGGGVISIGFQRLASVGSVWTYFPLGLLLGLLPCGPVYTALIAAARFGMDASGTGQGFIKGMGLMLAFGVGTIPALFVVSKLAQLGWVKSREKIYRVSAVLMVLVGVYFVVKGVQY